MSTKPNISHLSFTLALLRLSSFRVGIAEATMLFLCASPKGETVASLNRAVRIGHANVRGRMRILRDKKLVSAKSGADGDLIFLLTDKGRTIVRSVLKPQPTTPNDPE